MWLKLCAIFILFVNVNSQCMEPYCSCSDSKTLCCNNFASFEELDFRKTNGRPFESVELTPRLGTQLDLDQKLKLNGLVLNGRLILNNIRSFTAFYNPFRQILTYRFDLTIQNSDLNFIGQNLNPVDIESAILNDCSYRLGAQNLDFVFGNLKITEFTVNDCRFSRPMCPYLFKNTEIKNMILNDPKGAFGFTKMKEDFNLELLNTNINQLYINHTLMNYQQQQWLDEENILNFNLFMNLNRINLNSAPRLNYIQENTFNRFKNLRVFEINNVNMYNLLSKSRRWLKNLNYMSPTYDMDRIVLNSSVSMSNSIFQLIIWGDDLEQKWSFNDDPRDICLFRNFPHNKLVFPFILFTNENTFKCTCTVYWLYKYFYKYQSIYNLNQNIVPYHCFKNSNWSSQCKFDELFDLYCPKYIPDPEESFTTLKPTSGNTQSPIYPTFSSSHSTYFTAINTPLTSVYSSSNAPAIIDNNSSNMGGMNNASLRAAAFYLAILLSITCFFIISALIVLFYQVFNQNRQLNKLKKAKSQTNDISSEIYI